MTQTSYTFNGIDGNDRAGFAMSSAGDFDNDGIEDIIISANRADDGSLLRVGHTYLISGADLEALDAQTGNGGTADDGVIELADVADLTASGSGNSYQFTGTNSTTWSGSAVSAAGDLNGDGFDDIIIGAPAQIGDNDDQVYVISGADLAALDNFDGPANGEINLADIAAASAADPALDSYEINSELLQAGFSLDSVGDVTGDGIDDFIIGAPNAEGAAGRGVGASYLISGADLGALDDLVGSGGTAGDHVIDLDDVSSLVASGSGNSYQFIYSDAFTNSGRSVSSAGDVDGDGINDLIIGTPRADPDGREYAGETYVISGADLIALDNASTPNDGVIELTDVAALTASGTGSSYQFNGALGSTGFPDRGDQSGDEVSPAGDVDGDGLGDILIAAVGADPNGNFYAGQIYFIAAADFEALDNATGNGGTAGDGVIELADVAALTASGAGASYQFNGSTSNGKAGYDLASLGDVDGDGLGDFLIGEIEDGPGNLGRSYLISGADLADLDDLSVASDGIIELSDVASLTASGSGSSYEIEGVSASNFAGRVASAGDVDGDGLGDLMIGATGADPNGNDSGQAYFISGADLAFADDTGTGADGVISLSDIFWNGTVEGTSGDDLIDANFTGDPTLDRVTDSDDSITAGNGNDTIVMSAGNDTIDGGAGIDTLQAAPTIVGSYTFLDGSRFGSSLDAIGDANGDGVDDFIIGDNPGSAYLISGADLAALDAADGSLDGDVDLGLVGGIAGSYIFAGDAGNSQVVTDVSSAGDVDNDGIADLLIGSVSSGSSGESYLVLGSDLAALDAASGSDGTILLSDIAVTGGSYEFIGGANGDTASFISSAGDVDGDGRDDILITAPGANSFSYYGTTYTSGETYLILAADLATLDADSDGIINLSDVAGTGGSYQFNDVTTGYSNISIGGLTSASTVPGLASVGDIDGDGLDDFMIGRPAYDGGFYGTYTYTSGAYLILSKDLAAIDGNGDGVIDNEDISSSGGSYEFVSEPYVDDRVGFSVSGAGDVDGDGISDLLIGAPGGYYSATTTSEVYFISGADLDDLDIADGTADGRIELSNVASVGNSYQFNGASVNDDAGASVASAGDVDGDGLQDFLIGAPGAENTNPASSSGEAYLIMGADLADLDAADGTVDGDIDLGLVAGTGGSYQFTGEALGDGVGVVSSAGDVDGDGLDDLLVSGQYVAGGVTAADTYLILAADLADADAADGTIDGNINLGLLPAVDADNIVVDIDNSGSGTATQAGAGTSDLTSVESFIANETPGQTDVITITDLTVDSTIVDATGELFDPAVVSGLDDNAAGTFTPLNGDPVIVFGPTEAVQLSNILSGTAAGQIQITGGDETGTVGNISFENFEEINFGIVCFAAGTRIATPQGEKFIEDLEPGDLVQTLDAGLQPIRWIGSTVRGKAALAANPKLRPVRIGAGALGNGLPQRDLVVSRQHRVLIRSRVAMRMFGSLEVLIPAIKLLGLPGVEVDQDIEQVEYFHMLFDDHQVVYSNGAPTESLFTGPEALKAVSAEAREEITELFPEIVEPDFDPSPARPIPETGKEMKKLVERLIKNNKSPLEAWYSQVGQQGAAADRLRA